MTQGDMAQLLKKSDAWVSQRLKLYRNAAPELRNAFEEGIITASGAQALASLPQDDQRLALEQMRESKPSKSKPESLEAGRLEESSDSSNEINGIPKPEGEEEIDSTHFAIGKELYDTSSWRLRGKRRVVGMLGLLSQVLDKAVESKDALVEAQIKAQISALEWIVGERQSLGW